MENYTDRASNALHAISFALDESFPPETRADEVRRAAAEVRAWRKSLGVKSERVSFTSRGSARVSLRNAAWSVLTADESKNNAVLATPLHELRDAEAHLREAARLLDKEQT